MHAVATIAGTDLRQRLRDRSAIVLGFVAPLAVATLMSLAFGGSENFHFSVGVVDQDGGPVASALVDVLRSPQLRDVLTVHRLPTAATASTRVDDGDVATAIVIPAGFSDAAMSSEHAAGASIRVLTSADAQRAAAWPGPSPRASSPR